MVPCRIQFRKMCTRLPSGLFDQALELFQFLRIDLIVIEHVRDEQAWGSIEEPADEMLEGTAPGLSFVHDGPEHERAADLVVGDVALLLQDAQKSLHRAVGERVTVAQGGHYIRDSRDG